MLTKKIVKPYGIYDFIYTWKKENRDFFLWVANQFNSFNNLKTRKPGKTLHSAYHEDI